MVLNWLRHGVVVCALLAGPLVPGLAAAQGYGSAAVANVGPPSDALFPDLAALQDRLEQQGWMLRGQATFILQGNTNFRSTYSGDGSLKAVANARNTLSTDLVIGRQLWEGAEVIVDAAVTRGFGLSNSVGVANFPNNEAFRLGSTDPTFFVPRAFFRQTIGLSGDTVEDADPLRFGSSRPRERLTFTLGKISVWDIFDDNLYAHDARTQFLGWALVGSGAFDFAADARGWTEGGAVEWDNGTWGIRTGAFRVAREANGLFLDPSVTRGFQAIGQVDRFFRLGDRPGAIRLLYGYSQARQSTWDQLDANGFDTFKKNPTKYNGKHNLALNAEQELSDWIGAFLRLSWNDGRTQNWMYTEMDRAVSAGLSFDGKRWDRAGDTVGLAFNLGWISSGRQRYMEAGGIGFITGDGRLNYAAESVIETYYDIRLAPGVNLAANAQLVINPAYNADRGPVPIFAVRMHTAF